MWRPPRPRVSAKFVVLVLAISTTKAIRSNKLHDICQQQMELQKTSGAIEVYMDSLQWAMEDNLGKLKTKVRELEEKANRNEGIAKIQDYQAICLSYQRTMPEDCAEIYSRGEKNSGVYAIWPRFYNKPITVFCDMKTHGGGWTVFQRRDDFGEPRQDFFLEWSDYREGFGNLSGEFWLGNEALFALTNQDRMLLRVELEDFNETRRYAIYEGFIVRSEQEHYTMTYSTYEGDAGDSLLHSKDVPFTTRDKKNDFSDKNCAEVYKGAWWYRSCHESNLNGLYLRGHHSSFADGINWKTFKGYNYSLKFTEMKIRPKSFDTKRETK